MVHRGFTNDFSYTVVFKRDAFENTLIIRKYNSSVTKFKYLDGIGLFLQFNKFCIRVLKFKEQHHFNEKPML
jgi:hypothetical protein